MLYISTSALKRKSIIDSVNDLLKITSNIELSGGTQYQKNLLESLVALKKSKKINFILHSYFPPPKDSFVLNFADESEKTRNFITLAMKYIKALDIDYYSIHSGFKQRYKFDNELLIDGESSFKKKSILNNINWFYTLYPKYKIALENLFPNNKNLNCCFMMSIDSISEILDSDKRIYLLLDLGHLKISSNYFKFDYLDAVDILFSKYSHRILEIHLSENSGLKDEHLDITKESTQCLVIEKYRDLINKNRINVVIESRINDLDKLKTSYYLFKSILKG